MASPRIVMITSDHRRHRWVASRLAQAGNLVGIVAERKPATSPSSTTNSDMTVQSYFRVRNEAEHRYFADAPVYEALGAAVPRVTWSGANAPETLDFVTDALHLMQRNVAEGMIDRYVREKPHRDARYPIEAVLPVC